MNEEQKERKAELLEEYENLKSSYEYNQQILVDLENAMQEIEGELDIYE